MGTSKVVFVCLTKPKASATWTGPALIAVSTEPLGVTECVDSESPGSAAAYGGIIEHAVGMRINCDMPLLGKLRVARRGQCIYGRKLRLKCYLVSSNATRDMKQAELLTKPSMHQIEHWLNQVGVIPAAFRS